ncbi:MULTISPECIES: OmpA family protein [Pseudomonas]|uniref:OmpA family protein n=1 Tax=Pseudomonadaceae TaxID=135621 RepID=UPI00084AD9A7|nr:MULTISPECIES: OmpA family protein [Pseudomonas]OEC56221.1 hypothetical protein A9G05_16685 [Pseudomonas sp. ENNP23]
MRTLKHTIPAIALLAALGYAATAPAALSEQAFEEPYSPMPEPSRSQAQVIYYRLDTEQSSPDGALLYVDGELHTSLLNGGYTRFCLNPGQHTLGAFLNEAPTYRGKADTPFELNLEGGRTYFMQAELASGRPVPLSREEAETQLTKTRRQAHLLSRASNVQACVETVPVATPSPTPVYKDYDLPSDVLFAFGKSERKDITGAGRKAISELIAALHREHANLRRILVVGHTDPIGRAETNLALGLRRAQTVRQFLIDGGIPEHVLETASMGSTELVVADCHGNRDEQIRCNAPNRRVMVRVDVSQAHANP